MSLSRMPRASFAAATLLALSLAAPVVAAAPATSTTSETEHHAFPARIDLPNGWQPEGITAWRDSTVYVGSLANGAIWRGNVRTGHGSVFVPGVQGRVAVGVEFDFRSDRLWVAGGPTGTVRVYSARNGALLQTYQFANPGFLNDLVVTRDAVYVTDSNRAQLDVIPLGDDGRLLPPGAARVLPLSGDFQLVPNALNLNGIVSDGRALVAVSTVTGQLFRIDPRTGVARLVDTHGATFVNGDGLELVGSTLFVSRNMNDLVVAVRLSHDARFGRVLREITSPDLDVQSTIAFQDGFLWAVNARFSTAPTPTTPYWITRLPAFGHD